MFYLIKIDSFNIIQKPTYICIYLCIYLLNLSYIIK